MRLSDVAMLLTEASMVDGRPEPTEAECRAWHPLVEDVPAHLALDALRVHYTESRHRLMPADIIERVAELEDQARMACRPWPPPEPAGGVPWTITKAMGRALPPGGQA